MYFGALSPETNSGRMYTGPGSGSLIAAATAWDGLAAELQTTASSYSSVISGLTSGAWRGPSAIAMAAAAAPFVAWMSATAGQAAQAASQARAAAAAHATAFAATVPPTLVAVNRSQLSSMVATNIFGQNSAAIATNEAQYGQMWAQDAATMYTYAAQSAVASAVTPFTSPPLTTNPGGLPGQLAATGQALATSVGTSAQTQLSQVVTAVPTALQSLAAITTSPDPLQGLLTSLQSFAASQSLSSISADIELIPKLILPVNDIMITTIFGVAAGTKFLASAPAAGAAALGGVGALGAGLGSTGLASVSGSAVSAATGNAGLVGGLAVPPSWATATPAIRTVAEVLSSAGEGAVPAAAVSEGSLLDGLALAGMAGSAFGAAAPSALAGTGPRNRSTALKDNRSPEKLRRLVAELSQKPESVQHWHTDSTKLDSLLDELSRKPGIHAVHLTKSDPTKPKPSKSKFL